MQKAKIRFVVITGMLLKLLSVTIYGESALALSLPLPGGFLPGDKPVINAGMNLAESPLSDESSTGTLMSYVNSREDTLTLGDTTSTDSPIGTNGPQAALLAANTWITVSPASGQYTGTVTLSATLRKLIPPTAVVSGKTITFKLDDRTVGSAVTNKDGVATLADVRLPENLNVGIHLDAIQADFAGDGSYKKSSGTGILTVTYAPTELKADNITAYYGGNATVRATLKSAITGEGLRDKVITVLVNNGIEGMAVTDANGVAAMDVDLTNMDVGSYPILVTFLQVVGNYAPNTASATLRIEELPTSLTVSPSTGTYGGSVTLQALLSASGTPLGNKTVTFSVNGNPAGSAKTQSDGIASIQFSLAGFDAGSYPGAIKAEFDARNFGASSAAGDLVVLQAPTAITVSNAAGTFGGTTELSALLTSGGIPLGGMTISFKLQGTTVGDALSGSDGKAVLKNVSLSGIDAGNYTAAVVADFEASGNYSSSSSSGSLRVDQAPSEVVVQSVCGNYGGKVTLKAKLTAVQSGIPLEGRTLLFKLNGEDKGSALTGPDGLASLPDVSIEGIATGTYDDYIEASFSPSGGNYAPASGKGSLKVDLAPTSIMVNKITAVYGSKVDLEAILTCFGNPLSGKPVEFRLNGQFVGAAITNSEGKAIKNCIDLSELGAGLHLGAFCASFIEADPYKGCSSSADV